jgi:hypothetical protein
MPISRVDTEATFLCPPAERSLKHKGLALESHRWEIKKY